MHRLQAAGSNWPAAGTLDNFKLVGHSSLDGFGDSGDLFTHGNFAYVGSRCGQGRKAATVSRSWTSPTHATPMS